MAKKHNRGQLVALLNSLRARRDDPKCGIRMKAELEIQINDIIGEIRELDAALKQDSAD